MQIMVPRGTDSQDETTTTEWAVECCGAIFPSADRAHARTVCAMFNTRANHPHSAVVIRRFVTTLGWRTADSAEPCKYVPTSRSTGDDRYPRWAVCKTCGWRGADRAHWEDAEVDFAKHQAEQLGGDA